MAEVITSAGLASVEMPAPSDPRKDAIRSVRAVIRNPKSTDADIDDALEALIELSRGDD